MREKRDKWMVGKKMWYVDCVEKKKKKKKKSGGTGTKGERGKKI
jgi:hypothetical protein